MKIPVSMLLADKEWVTAFKAVLRLNGKVSSGMALHMACQMVDWSKYTYTVFDEHSHRFIDGIDRIRDEVYGGGK